MTTPRTPTPEDRESWLLARDQQQEPPRPQDRETLRAYMAKKSPLRWRRFESDFKHLGKIYAKLGMNPEDVRWLL